MDVVVDSMVVDKSESEDFGKLDGMDGTESIVDIDHIGEEDIVEDIVHIVHTVVDCKIVVDHSQVDTDIAHTVAPYMDELDENSSERSERKDRIGME